MKTKDILIEEWYKTNKGIAFTLKKIDNKYLCEMDEGNFTAFINFKKIKNTDIKYPVVKRWVRKNDKR